MVSISCSQGRLRHEVTDIVRIAPTLHKANYNPTPVPVSLTLVTSILVSINLQDLSSNFDIFQFLHFIFVFDIFNVQYSPLKRGIYSCLISFCFHSFFLFLSNTVFYAAQDDLKLWARCLSLPLPTAPSATEYCLGCCGISCTTHGHT